MPLSSYRPAPGPGGPASAPGRGPGGAPSRPRPGPARRRAALGLLAAASLVAAGLPDAAPLGVGDRLYPHLGNPGYDVRAYDIALTYPGRNDRPLDAVTKITARATARLERVNLDFAHGTVRSVEVNGRRAAHVTRGEDLIVTPRQAVRSGTPLRIVVRHTSDPRPGKGGKGGREDGWLRTKDGLVMANQVDAAHRIFPGNDHPSDKALYTFRVTAPKGLTVVAGGLPVGRYPATVRTVPDAGGKRAGHGMRHTRAVPATTWVYRSAHPVATEVVQVSIGRSAVVRRTGPHGLPLRDVVPAADRKRLEPWLAKTPGQLSWMEKKVGRYPFEAYGVLLAQAETGFELETQTLSLFEERLFTGGQYPRWYIEAIMVHELAHQWFGDSVSPRTWSDAWLNESHATWYEELYAHEHAKRSMDERTRRAYSVSDRLRREGGPPGAPKPPTPGNKTGIFRPVMYDGSALVLYALRAKIGHAAFDRLERAWVTRHRDGVAGTADFVALASRISGQNLTGFFHSWLYDTKTPPMPGHPDWKSTYQTPHPPTRKPAAKPAKTRPAAAHGKPA
ncbi:M1 family metallopeptidase [Streptomyces sp. NRRL F-5755]|uniref:M1 family metallopeptidase n=1 Tax=Streptomyces sp. NRRL F-5755 TaxID=1519475 RepID=UPI000AA77DC1|nr:M1 family metallopeptidase [Streptomyces sp. NRRL F-5755]